jgi:transposase
MRKFGVGRDELHAQLDKPALKALPPMPYQCAEWKKCRVAPDYHVELAGHYYSVPSRLIGEELEARITDRTIEILHKGVRVASHARSHVPRRHTTIPEHMPSAHRRYAEWTPAPIRREAASIGPATIALSSRRS